MVFTNRNDAGKALVPHLQKLIQYHPFIVALPRGGVVVAFPIAESIHIPLDVLVVRKIRAPHNSELAIGAIAPDLYPIFDEQFVHRMEYTKESLIHQTEIARQELLNKQKFFKEFIHPNLYLSKTVILVDDGLATGYTMRAAVHYVRRYKPERLIIAVPVASYHACALLQPLVDDLICLSKPAEFQAVGQVYQNFEQVEDEAVLNLLVKSREVEVA